VYYHAEMVSSEGQSSLKGKMLALVSVLASKLALVSALYIWLRPGFDHSTLALLTLWSLRCHCDFYSSTFVLNFVLLFCS